MCYYYIRDYIDHHPLNETRCVKYVAQFLRHMQSSAMHLPDGCQRMETFYSQIIELPTIAFKLRTIMNQQSIVFNQVTQMKLCQTVTDTFYNSYRAVKRITSKVKHTPGCIWKVEQVCLNTH